MRAKGSGRRIVQCLVIFVGLLAGTTGSVSAQAITATLRGKVVDPEATPMPGVPVTVSSASRGGSTRTVLTDLQGRYKFPLLVPSSDYYLQVTYPGFASTEIGPIDLDAGKTTLVDISLQTSEKLTERIEVTAHGNVVDTTSTKTSTTFNTEFVEGLPIIGRSYQDILTLTSGVTDTDGDGNPNVQGARETGLQYRLDGSNITDPVSGTSGQNLNIDAIEEIEMITAGAGAEYGRADGGFANIITKSGGNDFVGSFRLFWRGRILDGDGAGENNDTFDGAATPESDLRELSAFLTLGGAIVKDRLWYFTSFQSLDRIDSLNLAGATLEQEARGHTFFGKVTWQADADNKLALQFSEDPYELEGEFLDLGVDPDSDALVERGAQITQIRWTSIASPTLLVEALFSRYDGGVSLTPESDRFHLTKIETHVESIGGLSNVRARYPITECSSNGDLSGFIPNCDARWGNPSIYQVDPLHGTTTGPYPDMTDDSRVRTSLKADVTYTLEDAWGEHQLKAGLEFADERFEDDLINNPFFVNYYDRCADFADICATPGAVCPPECGTGIGFDPQNVIGFQVLSDPTPARLDQKVESFNSAIYLSDVWKPRPNVAVQAGLRLDQESIDTSGFTPFDPRDEKRKSISIVEGLCDDGIRVARFGSGMSNADRVCDVHGRIPGAPPQFNLVYRFDSQTPRNLRQYDRNLDGVFDSGADGPAWLDPYTSFPERSTENFGIENLNLSPRFSVSWDPAADGRTKVYATWGRYYDRLFLDTVDDEIGPDVVNYAFFPQPGAGEFLPGELSSISSAASLHQVDRNLRTPFTDVFTIGFEREVAPEWAARITYTQRLGWDLLQDTDLNHLECSGFPGEFDIRKQDVCALFTDTSGKVHLTDDKFGTVEQFLQSQPNGAPDLYIVNPAFNQVLRTGNVNSSRYRSIAGELNRRLHRNWQMQLSYTYSRAYGQAEDFGSTLGNDPSTSDDEDGYLDYDQRHRVLVLATTRLPKDIELGTTIAWETGTPYSVISQVPDADNDGNISFRTFYPSDQRNDQRNNGAWKIDTKIIRRFILGGAAASASLAVNNLLNEDDLTVGAFRTSSLSGVQLQRGPQGLRRFGRYWELGLTLSF